MCVRRSSAGTRKERESVFVIRILLRVETENEQLFQSKTVKKVNETKILRFLNEIEQHGTFIAKHYMCRLWRKRCTYVYIQLSMGESEWCIVCCIFGVKQNQSSRRLRQVLWRLSSNSAALSLAPPCTLRFCFQYLGCGCFSPDFVSYVVACRI